MKVPGGWQGNLGYVVAVEGGGVPGDGGTNEGVWVRHEVRDERKAKRTHRR